MTPTYEELLKGATTWRFELEGVAYTLSHHAYRDGAEYEGAEPHPGIWCYYLLIPEQMFPHRWSDFACVRGEHGFEQPGPAWQHDWFDTEITWSSSEPYYDRKENRVFDLAKVGCDYAHLWHAERGYPDTFVSVKADAEHTVRQFIEANPDRKLKSGYSHRWGEPGDFYTAINGALVHREDDIPDGWEKWKPSAEDQAESSQ